MQRREDSKDIDDIKILTHVGCEKQVNKYLKKEKEIAAKWHSSFLMNGIFIVALSLCIYTR